MSTPRSRADHLLPFLQLHLAKDIGSILAARLLRHFGSPQAVLSATPEALERVRQVGPLKAVAIREAADPAVANEQLALADSAGVRIVSIGDTDYPLPLRYIPDPPICLYVRGSWEPEDAVALAIVGTRRCSHYGREQARRFGQALGGAGFTVVSGLARGVDGVAHQGALQAGGRTMAVLGGGVDSVYPQEHSDLADRIADGGGALLSEYPLNVPPVAGNFPRRNRIIAGLSLGVLVIEAGRRSGACITARLAQEYNREVFAVPGRIDQPTLTAGVNRMIRDGHAKLVTGLEDVLEELEEVGAIMLDAGAPSGADAVSHSTRDVRCARSLAPPEKAVFQAVRDGGAKLEEILRLSRQSIASVNACLVSLQLKGLIDSFPGNEYRVRRSAGRSDELVDES